MVGELGSQRQSPNFPPDFLALLITRNPISSNGPATAPTRKPLRFAAGPEYRSRTSAQATAAPTAIARLRGGRSAVPDGFDSLRPPPGSPGSPLGGGGLPASSGLGGGGGGGLPAPGLGGGGGGGGPSGTSTAAKKLARRSLTNVPSRPKTSAKASGNPHDTFDHAADAHNPGTIQRRNGPAKWSSSKRRISGPPTSALSITSHTSNRAIRGA